MLYESGNSRRDIAGSFLAVGIAFGAGIIIISLTSRAPGEALYSFFLGPFSSGYNISTLLTSMIPLIITGIALSVSFQSQVWNLAADGQVYFGAFIGIAVGLGIPHLPSFIAVPVILLASVIAGAAVGILPAILKIKLNVNELIISFMTSLIIIPVVNYFLSGPMQAPGEGINATNYVNKAFVLPKLFPPYDLNAGFIIALVLILVVYLFLYRTHAGTSLRLYGFNREFAHYGGISEARTIFLSMMMSGGLCGLAGCITSLGIYHGRLIEFSTSGFGWSGIAVALVARYNPIAVLPAALLLSYLLTGANLSGLMSDIPPETAQVVIAVIYYLVTAKVLLKLIPKKKQGV
jgi:simple sugar transport system permease protein